MSRPRVLISAFSCNPERGSEPGVGHFFVSALAEHCDLTVITESVENRAAIERRQDIDPVYAGIDFKFIPWPELDDEGRRIDDRSSYHFYKCLRRWERRAFRLARTLSREHQFDLTHHLTMQGYREPGYLWRLPLPFVWGPVGGHAQMPWRYFPMLGWRGWLRYGTRNIGNTIQARLHGRVHKAAAAAKAIIVNTSAEKRAFEKHHGVSPTVIAEFGAEPTDVQPRPRNNNEPFRIAWSGVHVPRKGLPILLHAMARLPQDLKIEAHILSNGPEEFRWQALARKLGVAHKCIWHGRLPRTQAIATMAKCDVFALTSLLDGTSCVLNEAISVGLPVICHDACGFADIVDDTCGILVPLRSPAASAKEFARAITELATNEARYESLRDGALRRANEISADVRARQMLAVYERVLGRPIESSHIDRVVSLACGVAS